VFCAERGEKLSAVQDVTKGKFRCVEGVDNKYGACNDVKHNHDPAFAVATHCGLDCLGAKYQCGLRFFATVMKGPRGPTIYLYIAYCLLLGVQRRGSLTLTSHPSVGTMLNRQYSYSATAFWCCMWGEL